MDLSLGFISMPGGSEWIIIFLVILIFFGPKSLPKIGKAIGQGIREFKDASDGIARAIEEEVSAAERGDEARGYGEPTPDTASPDEPTPDEASPGEASLDEVSPGETSLDESRDHERSSQGD